MNQPDPNQFREATWRPLTEAERDTLRAARARNPDALADLETEVALTNVLAKLPDAPVSSNFTARVLQAVELEARRQERRSENPFLLWLRRGWLQKGAFASLLVGAGLFGFHQHNIVARARLAHEVAAVSTASAVSAEVSNPEDFEAIRLLNKPASADVDLLVALSR